MQKPPKINVLLYAAVMVAGLIGTQGYQINDAPSSFFNITFIMMYAILLAVVVLPLFTSEMVVGLLSKKNLHGSIKYASGSNRLRFILLLSFLLAIIFLVMMVVNSAATAVSLFYQTDWYLSTSKSQSPLTNSALLVTLITIFLVILLIWISQRKKRFIAYSGAFATLGLLCLACTFTISGFLLFNSNHALLHFFTPNFKLFSLFPAWQSAFILALFSCLIGLGVNTLLGSLINHTFPIKRLCWIQFTLSIIVVMIVMLAKIFLLGFAEMLIHSTTNMHTNIGLLYIVTLSGLGIYFFCSIVTAILLCQVFKADKNTPLASAKWYAYTPFFILLFTAAVLYSLLPQKLHLILQNDIVMNLVLLVAYFEILVFGWIFDAQKLSYQLQKMTRIKLSPIYNISIRLIAPAIILSTLLYKLLSPLLSINWLVMTGMFIASALLTITIGSILHRKFQ